VLEYIGEWNRFSERMGMWVDLEDPYYTMDNSFIESVWALLKIIWEKGLIYQGFRVTPIDPVMGTTMSDAEVDLGYKETEDPSLTVRFFLDADALAAKNKQLADRLGPDASFLVWTTTPWTLPSNAALALHPEEEYVLVERTLDENEPRAGERERVICAAALYDEVFANRTEAAQIVDRLRGKELIDVPYQQILNYVQIDPEQRAFYTVAADFVTMDTGTGIVHIAPAYGADDLTVGQKRGLPVIHAVGLDGRFAEGTPRAGQFFKEADKEIIKELKGAGKVWKSERYKHNYPFGYRTGAPLIYFAKNAWYIRTTDLKDELIQNNETINWTPEHIKRGRFGNWLENNRDWALSRERYWGIPLPVWTDGEGGFRIVGSVAELEALSGKNFAGELDLHRPHVDDITFTDPDSGKTMRRVPEVIDCWFDSGSMPYAQWGYPVRGHAEFEQYFPADFISEAIDQTRGWFYTLLAVSTMVSGKASYKNVVCLGHVLDEKGEKMSKSKGNVVSPWDVFEQHGADAIRWYFLTNSPPGNSRRVGRPGDRNDPVTIVHGFLNMLQNSVNFFTLYANVDGVAIQDDWRDNPIAGAPPFAKRAAMDRWILSAREELIRTAAERLDDYDAQGAGRAIETFADSLSNWYIRRNRRRFWKGELDADKLAAYDTLHRCLVSLAQMIAPFAPFLAEDIFRVLVTDAPRAKQTAQKTRAEAATARSAQASVAELKVDLRAPERRVRSSDAKASQKKAAKTKAKAAGKKKTAKKQSKAASAAQAAAKKSAKKAAKKTAKKQAKSASKPAKKTAKTASDGAAVRAISEEAQRAADQAQKQAKDARDNAKAADDQALQATRRSIERTSTPIRQQRKAADQKKKQVAKAAPDRARVAANPESVHLAGWPVSNPELYDAAILREGELVKQAAFLGRAARMESGVKVRQPLRLMMVHVERAEDRAAIEANRETLLDELNVKELEFVDEAAGILEYRVKPNLPRLGKRLGPRIKIVQQYLGSADHRSIAQKARAGESVALEAGRDEPPIELEPEDFLIESVSKEGVSGAEGQGMLVAFDTRLTPELIREGMARDLIRNVQELRKKSGLEVTDRIVCGLDLSQCDAELEQAVQEHAEYIEAETLATLQTAERQAAAGGAKKSGGKGDAKPVGSMEAQIEKQPLGIRIWKA